MQTLLLGLQLMGYVLLSVCAILGLIFVLMKLTDRLTRRKNRSETPPDEERHKTS